MEKFHSDRRGFLYHFFLVNRKKTGSPQTIASDASSQEGGSSAAITPTGTPPSSSKEAWPSLQLTGSPSSQSPETVIGRPECLTNGNKSKSKHDTADAENRAPGHHRAKYISGDSEQNRYELQHMVTRDGWSDI